MLNFTNVNGRWLEARQWNDPRATLRRYIDWFGDPTPDRWDRVLAQFRQLDTSMGGFSNNYDIWTYDCSSGAVLDCPNFIQTLFTGGEYAKVRHRM